MVIIVVVTIIEVAVVAKIVVTVNFNTIAVPVCINVVVAHTIVSRNVGGIMWA